MGAGKKGVEVVMRSRVELEPEVVEDDSIVLNPEAFKEAVERLLEKNGGGSAESRNVIIALPEGKTFSHRLGLPVGHAYDEESILAAAKNYIPIELSDAVVDYKPLPGRDTERVAFFDVTAAQKNLVEALVSILSDAGLNVVAVDSAKDALVRSCLYSGPKPDPQLKEGDLMTISVEEKGSYFNIRTHSGETHTLDSSIGCRRLVEKVKAGLAISTFSEARARFGSSDAKSGLALREAIQEELRGLARRAMELATIVGGQEEIKIRKIRIVGGCAFVPGLDGVLKEAFPEAEVAFGVAGYGLKESTCEYAKAIGLALRTVVPEAHERGVNLLTQSRKDAVDFHLWKPRILKGMLGLAAGLMILSGLSGYGWATSRLGVKIARQELAVSVEKIQNPYLNQLAQASQQKSRLEGEMSTILKDALPMSLLMRKIDGYNAGGVGLVNVSYYIDSVGSLFVRLKGRSESREATEQFILGIEKDPYFTNIISPLSNLVGKGERFITIDMAIKPDALMGDYEKALAEKQAAEKPAAVAPGDSAADATTKEPDATPAEPLAVPPAEATVTPKK